MKTLSSLLLIATISAPLFSQAGNPNLDPKFKYCDDMIMVDNLNDRRSESLERLKGDGVTTERILISKEQKKIYLISGASVLRVYDVAFGSNPNGHKEIEGDGKTPEGVYSIDYKNEKSDFHLSLRINYPNSADRAKAKKLGKSPGGNIMIHGLPNPGRPWGDLARAVHPFNWTNGCVAVTDKEIEDVFALVKEKTLVEVCAMPKTEQPEYEFRY